MTCCQYRPAVSIVTSFCREPLQWIQSAYGSVLAQTFTDYEMIIICDDPANTEAISYIQGLDDKRIKLIINAENLGPTKSFNIGLAAARGKYIARFDADDICMPERLEKQVEYLEVHPDVSVCATDAHIIDSEGKITRRNKYRHKRDHTLLAIRNCIAHPSVMFRRSLMELRDPLYNEEYTYAQDYELWQYLILNGHRFHTLKDTLILYRKGGSQISSAKIMQQTAFFRKAHKSFIINWLTSHGIISPEDSDDFVKMLSRCSEAFPDSTGEDRRFLEKIIYVLYFSLSIQDHTYRLRYLMDRNLIAFRLRFILTYRLLFARRTSKVSPALF